MEREKGDSSILQLRPDCLMVLRIVSQTVAVGSMVGFYFFQSELNLLVNISNSFNASVLFVCLFVLLFFFLPPLFKTTEGVVVGFQIFAWTPKKK